MRIFVSCQAVDADAPSRLITALRARGADVQHSPRNPADGPDARWDDWYAKGLDAALRRSAVFVIVLDRGWDSSSWMAQEAQTAKALAARDGWPRTCHWNPDDLVVTAAGMTPYLRRALNRKLDDAVNELVALANGPLSLEELPLASPSRESYALEVFRLDLSPDEYAARFGHQFALFPFDEYRYAHPGLTEWVQRLGDVFFHRRGAPSLREVRERYLTPEELAAAEKADEDAL